MKTACDLLLIILTIKKFNRYISITVTSLRKRYKVNDYSAQLDIISPTENEMIVLSPETSTF